MASTTFIDNQTVIQASWLNDVNTATYTDIPAIKSADWVTTIRIATGAVTPEKLSTGAPSWNEAGDLTVPSALITTNGVFWQYLGSPSTIFMDETTVNTTAPTVILNSSVKTQFLAGGVSAAHMDANTGYFGFGVGFIGTPTSVVDIQGTTLRLRTNKTPASATATGNKGDICWDTNYMYVCVNTNTWKRTALTTW